MTTPEPRTGRVPRHSDGAGSAQLVGGGAHHDSSERYLSDPNPEVGDTVTVWARTPLGVTDVTVRAVWDGEPFRFPAVADRTTGAEVWWRAELPVRAPVVSYRFHLRDRTSRTRWLNGEGVRSWDVTDAADFRLSTAHRPPDWVRRTVWYQVFPDRFARRPDGRLEAELPDWAIGREWADPVTTERPDAMRMMWGGSLNGVTAHLDHLADVGVTGIYTCPFFPARSNHRYDATTFDHVDPLLGGDGALRRLLDEAGRRGMRVIGDLTTNHSGVHHDWFTAARDDPAAPTREFYTFAADGSYDAWLGVPSLPKLNHRSAKLRRRLYEGPGSAAGRLLADGLAGWRIDVANMTGRSGAIDVNRQCAEGLRRTIDAVRPDGWLLAEHMHDASADLDGGGWHGTMNYTGLTRPAWTWLVGDGVEVSLLGDPGELARRSGGEVARSARAFMSRIPYSVALTNMNLLGSHDTARWAYVTGDDRHRSEVGLAMLMTWPGSPSLFYGDEVGLGGGASFDIPARAPFPWHDPASWNRDLLTTVRELVGLRTSSSALAVGGMRWIAIGDDHLVYVRESRDHAILVHLARAAHGPLTVDLASLGMTDAARVAGSTAAALDGTTLTAEGASWQLVALS